MTYRFENDDRMLTMKELEKILCRSFGCTDDDDRDRGTYKNGRWFSIESILEKVSGKI